MAIITTLKDESGTTTLYPITKTNAVFDSNNTSLDSIISSLQSGKQNVIQGIANYVFGTYLEINGTNMTDFVVESGSDYIRFINGIQFCWGTVPGQGSITNTTVNLPKSFINTNYIVVWGERDSTSTNAISIRVNASNDRTNGTFKTYSFESVTKLYLAVGLWK